MKALSVFFFALLANSALAQKTWIAAGASNWNNGANWNPAGVPIPTDVVVFDGTANGNCTIDAALNPTVAAIQINGYTGDINLNGNTLSVAAGTANNTFNSGTLSGNGTLSLTTNFAASFAGTITGANVNLTATLSTAAGIFTGGAGSTFNGPVTITAVSILLNGSHYTNTVSFTKFGAGAANSHGSGSNIFDGATTIINRTNTDFRSAGTDTFNGKLTLWLRGTNPNCKIQLAYSAGNTLFNNDIRVQSDTTPGLATIAATAQITFGETTGTCTLANGFTITEANVENLVASFNDPALFGEFAIGDLWLNNFTQLGNTPQTINLRVPSPKASVSRLRLILSNCTFNGTIDFSASNVYVRNSTFNAAVTFHKTRGGGTDASFNPLPHPVNSWDGGNTFNSTFYLFNHHNSTLATARVNPDVFNGNVTLESEQATSHFWIGYRGITQFKGNLTIIKNTTAAPVVAFGDTLNQGTVEFSGAALQTINAPSTASIPKFFNLRMNNANGLTLNRRITITENVDLTLGLINTTATNYTLFGRNGSSTNGSNSSYVNGPARKWGNTAFAFPVGNLNVYQPIGISAPATLTSVFAAQYFKTNHGLGAAADVGIVQVSDCEYWTLSRIVNTDPVTVTLYYNPSSYCHPNYITDPNDLRVLRWSGTQWNDLGQSSNNAGPPGNFTASAQLSSFPGTLTLGSSTTDNALPIQLNWFDVLPSANGADVIWQTASENNNNYFTIERLHSDGFTPLTKIPGATSANLPTDYRWTDLNPLPGLSYYRLRQTDYDGRETVSHVVSFEWKTDAVPYPNPVSNTLYLHALSLTEDSNITVTDVSGHVLYKGKATQTVDFSFFASGVYHLAITSNGNVRWYSIKKD